MYLSIATTHRPATDLGYLLHKHPDRVHTTDLGFGRAVVVYPEAHDARCEAVLMLDVDPVALVRGRGGSDGLLDQYVNDRPYAATSFLAVALNKALRSAMSGTSKERPALAASPIALEAVVTPLPARDGADLVHALFRPLGWEVETTAIRGPDGTVSPSYVRLRLRGTGTLASLLTHLYVLIPVLDDAKHYWVDEAEIEKLLSRGAGWLETHPERDLITRRYLRNQRKLARLALARLAPESDTSLSDERPASEALFEAPIRLHDLRLDRAAEVLQAAGCRTIADLGCGEGLLLQRLAAAPGVRLIGLDPDTRSLEKAARRLRLRENGSPGSDRITLLHGSLTYRDRRWEHADGAALVEVIEHVDPERLPLLTRIVFGAPRLRVVVVTTPNAEYNRHYPTLSPGTFRHPDHRFEWTRAEFRSWAEGICTRFGWTVAFEDLGPSDPTSGAPSQMGVFTR